MAMKLTRRRLVKTAVAGSVLLAGCGDGEDPGADPQNDDTSTGGMSTEEGATPTDGGMSTEEGATPTDEGMSTEEGTETPGGGESTATVQVGSNSDIGEILVGPDGMTLYVFNEDTQGDGQSACTGDCTANWPPLTIEEGEPEAGENVTAELSTFEREDGSMQVTANGWPLYYFAEDEEPGDVNGQGVNEVWWVLGPDGSPIVSSGETTETETPTGN